MIGTIWDSSCQQAIEKVIKLVASSANTSCLDVVRVELLQVCGKKGVSEMFTQVVADKKLYAKDHKLC